MYVEFIHIKQLGNFKESLLSTFGSSSYKFILHGIKSSDSQY